MAYVKNFLKNLKEKLTPERAAVFQKGVTEFVKFVVSKFDEFEL